MDRIEETTDHFMNRPQPFRLGLLTIDGDGEETYSCPVTPAALMDGKTNLRPLNVHRS